MATCLEKWRASQPRLCDWVQERLRRRSRSFGFLDSITFGCVRPTCLSVRTWRSGGGRSSFGFFRTLAVVRSLFGPCARRSARDGWRRAKQENAIRTIWKAAWSNSVPCGRPPHSQEYNPKRYWSRIQQLNYLRWIMPVCICISERRRTCRNSRFAVTTFNWMPPLEDPMPATTCQLDQRHPIAIVQAFAHREYPCLLRIV